MLRILYQRTLGDSEAASDVLAFLAGASAGTHKAAADGGDGGAGTNPPPKLAPPSSAICAATGRPFDVRLFSWQLSYFSGKVRAYLRFKSRGADRLVFDDINASPALVSQLLLPLTHTNVVPQLQLPDGSFVQDSSDIIEAIEARFPRDPVVPSAATAPRQRLVCKLLELFGDEWLLTAAFHWRWAYSGDGSAAQQLSAPPLATAEASTTGYLRPNQRAYNELQWGDFIAPPGSTPGRRRRSGGMLFDNVLLSEHGARGGLRALGVTDPTMAAAFEAATLHFLALFEAHLAGGASFVLGHRPSLADYGLCGPLYAHLYADPVPGFLLRTRFPLVAQWCERLHDRGGQFHPQRRVTFDPERGALVDDPTVGGGAGHDGVGSWYADDAVPPGVTAMLRCFFAEMWPVLTSTMRVMDGYPRGSSASPLPSKSFSPTAPDQMGAGPLTHEFTLPDYAGAARGAPGGALRGRRMVVPYHCYMLQNLCDGYLAPARAACGESELAAFLRECGDPQQEGTGEEAGNARARRGQRQQHTPSLMELPELIARCRVVKRGGKIYRAPAPSKAEAEAARATAKL